MKYEPRIKQFPPLQEKVFDQIYLDTTYAHPIYTNSNNHSNSALVTLHTTSMVYDSMTNICHAFIEKYGKNGVIFLSAFEIYKYTLIYALVDALNINVFMPAEMIKVLSLIDNTSNFQERLAKG